MIKKCLIANRGEIAVRILSTCRKMGIRTVVAYSLADKESLAVTLADESVCIGPPLALSSYMNMDHLCEAALLTHCDAIAPGYGFLSEDPEFAKKVEDCGLTFVGPNSNVLKLIQNKNRLKNIVRSLSIPVIEGNTDEFQSAEELLAYADSLGYPLVLKPVSGGGGRGIQIVFDPHQLSKALQYSSLGFNALYLEKYIPNSRHFEVQILADKHHNVFHLSSRNCTLQVNHQKFLEEAPFSSIPPLLHAQIIEYALLIAKHIGCDNVATFEFLLDQHDRVYFMEVNPRIQVEHPLSEMITGIDIVEQQLLAASDEPFSIRQADIDVKGFAIECRINAQEPKKSFAPSAGIITTLHWPTIEHVRVDTALMEGTEVSIHYDSLIAKVIAWGQTRDQAMTRIICALEQTEINGIATNLDFLRFILNHDGFVKGNYTSDLFHIVHSQWINQPINMQHQNHDGQICPSCQKSLTTKQKKDHHHVCEFCGYHFRIPANQRIFDLIDSDTFIETDAQATSHNSDDFPGYCEKLMIAKTTTGMNEAVICGFGKINGVTVCIGVLDASFMMGSMGGVVGDKITRLIETAMDMCVPLIIISASGGARMQEGVISLMQMAKTTAALHRFDKNGGLYISVFTDPTTGGVTASFAMLGDILISEPQALIGFAGRRVIEKTIKESLPEEFQRAEYLLEHGFLDMIVDRRHLKQVLTDCLKLHQRRSYASDIE
jgi:acetyl-CoA carboxylase, biotin carboxylase subunit